MSKIREWCQVLVDSGVIPQMPANIDATIYEQYEKYLESENAELHHRAEVVERALDNTIKVFHEMLSAIFPSIKIDLDEWKKDNLAIAERELAEERE